MFISAVKLKILYGGALIYVLIEVMLGAELSIWSLITSPDRRLNVEQMKKHPFFYGVDWGTIRLIDAPFVPNLRSITDTSYFPTDELEEVQEEPVGADNSGANKDLAFLGYVQFFFLSESLVMVTTSCARYTFKRFQISGAV